MYVSGKKLGDLFENRGLANPALAVEHQDVVDEFSRQAALDPTEDILAAEKHTVSRRLAPRRYMD